MNGNHAVGEETTAHEFSPITTNEDYSIHNSCAFVLIRGKDKVRSIEKEKENEREKKTAHPHGRAVRLLYYSV